MVIINILIINKIYVKNVILHVWHALLNKNYVQAVKMASFYNIKIILVVNVLIIVRFVKIQKNVKHVTKVFIMIRIIYVKYALLDV